MDTHFLAGVATAEAISPDTRCDWIFRRTPNRRPRCEEPESPLLPDGGKVAEGNNRRYIQQKL